VSSGLVIYYLNGQEVLIEWELLTLARAYVNLIFIFDYISIFFVGLVGLVAGRVIIFRVSYMSQEIYFGRFIGLVLRFVASIYLLILRPNIISLLLGWDGLGVTSYLLVIFYQSSKSYNAGMITALTNRLGDVGLLVSLAIIISYGNWRYLYNTHGSEKLLAGLLIIIVVSACTKSAQIPFSAWLPAAMAAPTPVSALVHSSTLVTAGVYLLIRMNFLLVQTQMGEVLMVLGTMTIIIAGLAAMLEMDIKKVIALSTLRQLGVIMIILGGGRPVLAYFHLLSHAYFKAILFICAGIIIHNIKDYQDIRKMGRGQITLGLTIMILFRANLRLCGLPFLRGFYSKDIILEIILIGGINLMILVAVLFSTFLTVAYSCRLRFLVGLNYIKAETIFIIKDGDKIILAGMFILFPFAIGGGWLLRGALFSYRRLIFLPLWIKSRILRCIILAGVVVGAQYLGLFNQGSNKLVWFLGNMWFMPLTFRLASTNQGLRRSKIFYKFVEMSWAELLLFKKIVRLFARGGISEHFDFLSYSYILKVLEVTILLGVVMIVVYLSNLI